MEAQKLQLDLFAGERLARKPYCSDEKGFQRIASREQALRKKYIQPNPPCLLFRFVFDIDRPQAATSWHHLDAPAPNWTATNPENGHAHLGYEVEIPVVTSDAGRMAPVRFAAAIEAGLSELLNADVMFAGTLCKNPLHPAWITELWADEPYDLHTLGSYIPDLGSQGKAAKSRRRKSLRDVQGLGRNCILFDNCREWAYSAIRDYWGPGGEGAWFDAVRDNLEQMNCALTDPLGSQEIKHLAKSISSWTWKHTTPGGFRAAQAARGAKSGEKRGRQAAERAEQAKALKDQGMTQRQIAEEMGVSQKTVCNWLRRLSN